MIGPMIGLDTNVLVRYLTQDDPKQAARATRVVEEELSENVPGFIGLMVLVETVWVLQRLYGASAEESSCGFADAIPAAAALIAGCSKTLTFDRGAVRAGMALIE